MKKDNETPITSEEEIYGTDVVRAHQHSLTLEEVEGSFLTPLVDFWGHGIMSKGPGQYFGSSRDWNWNLPTIKCGRKSCAANYNSECVMPSLLEIGSNGKCKGYHKRVVVDVPKKKQRGLVVAEDDLLNGLRKKYKS